MAFLKITLLALLAASTTFAVDTTVNPTLDAKLKLAATALDRSALLPSNSDWTFDFTAQPFYSYAPGGVINANAATFPATVGTGMTLTWLALGPCAMLPPHEHPRATNFVVAIEGETTTYMIQENGAKMVTEVLTPGKMTIFPQGSVHSMQNMGCGNATLISALNSEDSGTNNLLNSLFTLPSDIVNAAFGQNAGAFGKDVPGIGTGAIMGSAECKAKCGIN